MYFPLFHSIVPANVRQIESDLNKECASVLRKAKAAASKDKSTSTPSSTGKKRKIEALGSLQQAKSSSTKTSVEFGYVTIDIDQQEILDSIALAKTQKRQGQLFQPRKHPLIVNLRYQIDYDQERVQGNQDLN